MNPEHQIVAERYVSLYANQNSIDEVVADIKVKQPDFVFCTLIGRTVPYFYKAYLKAGLDPSKTPVASLNTSEVEINMMGAEAAMGHYTSSPYFQSIDSPLTMIQHSSPGWLCGCGMVCGAIVQRFIPLGPPLQMCTQCAPTLLSRSKRFTTTRFSLGGVFAGTGSVLT